MGIIAPNAQAILDVRRKGLKPAELILVSMIGRLNEPNHTVYASSSKQYDWMWARGLQVCIYATAGIQWRGVARDLASAKPSWLGLWDADLHEGTDVFLLPDTSDIDKPQTDWRWNFHFLPWLPCENKDFAWN
jgi:hypothetical protein